MEMGSFLSDVAAAKAAIDSLSSASVTIDVNTAAAVTKVSALKAGLDALDGRTVDINLSTNADAVLTRLIALVTAIKGTSTAIGGMTKSIGNNMQRLDDWASVILIVDGILGMLNDTLDKTAAKLGVVSSQMILAMTAYAAMTQAQANLTNANNPLVAQAALLAAQAQLIRAQAAQQRANGGGGGWWGLLGGTVPLFGGLTAIAGWHVVFDAALESAIALTGALINLGGAAMAMAPAAQDIYTQLKSIHDVSVAFGVSGLGPLTGQFERLQHAVAPQTIEAFGGLLNLIGSKGGGVNQIITNTVNSLDTWIAKLDTFFSGGGGLTHVMQSGMGFLHQFEGVANNLGVSLTNLVKADPGTAHVLMDIVGGASQAIRAFTDLPTPILKSVMALHSLYLWGGLIVTALNFVRGRIVAMAASMVNLGRFAFANPSVVIGGGILAGLAYFVHQATSLPAYAQQEMSNFNSFMSNTSASGALTGMNQWIAKFQTQIPQAMKTATDATRAYETDAHSAIQHLANAFGANGSGPGSFFSNLFGAAENLGKAAFKFFPSMINSGQAQTWADQMQAAINKMLGSYKAMFQETGVLMGQNYNFAQSFALMDMAGVKTSDTFGQIQQKVQNLITGYRAMSIANGQLFNSANAVTFAAEQQNSQITAITQGWTAFIGLITGGASAFSTFEQQMIGLEQTAGNAAATVSVANGKVSVSTRGAAGSIGGITTAQLQQYQAFISGINDASNTMNQLYTLASAAQMGSRGIGMMSQAGKDLVAQFLPMAQGSKLLTTMLYGLAQQGGYRGANAFQDLAKWVGNTKNPVLDLMNIMTTFTAKAGNLAQDVANLANAINPNLQDAISKAMIAAGGGQQAFQNFFTTFHSQRPSVDNMTTSVQGVWRALTTVLGHSAAAKAEFETLFNTFGIGQKQADQLWNDLEKSGGQATAAVISDMARIASAVNSLPSHKTISIQTIMSQITTGSTGIPPGIAAPPPSSGGGAGGGGGGGGGPHNPPPGGLAPVFQVHVHLDGRELTQAIASRAVTTQRRTGTNGFTKRTR